VFGEWAASKITAGQTLAPLPSKNIGGVQSAPPTLPGAGVQTKTAVSLPNGLTHTTTVQQDGVSSTTVTGFMWVTAYGPPQFQAGKGTTASGQKVGPGSTASWMVAPADSATGKGTSYYPFGESAVDLQYGDKGGAPGRLDSCIRSGPLRAGARGVAWACAIALERGSNCHFPESSVAGGGASGS